MSRLELPLDRFTPGDLFPNGPGQHSQAILASVHATLATVTQFLLGPHLDTSKRCARTISDRASTTS
jgi:hypothetical protein